MIKLYRTIKFFLVYRRNILKNRTYLSEKFGLNISWIYEMYTTISLIDAPRELKEKYGAALPEFEIRNYIKSFNASLPKLELEELVNVYEIKKLNNTDYGVAFGYSLANNSKIIVSALSILLTLIIGILLIILL